MGETATQTRPQAETASAGAAAGIGFLPQSFPRLAFVHVPKTAGTSITHALSRHYGGLSCPAMTTLDYRIYGDEALAKYRFYKGHAYRRDYDRLPDDTIRFTVLRDPVSRARSYYTYYRSLNDSELTDPFVLEASRLAKTASPIEFVYSDSPFVIEHLRLGEVRQFLPEATLAAIGHRQFLSRDLRRTAVEDFIKELRRFSYVLTVESLPLSFPLMARDIGLPESVLALEWKNRSEPADGVDTADLRRAMVDVNAAGFECYAHAQRRERAWLTERLSPLLRLAPKAAEVKPVLACG
jgi:hypothetical protein